jgi:hypothetical protein
MKTLAKISPIFIIVLFFANLELLSSQESSTLSKQSTKSRGSLIGKVTDEEGKPLLGATVIIEGTGRGCNVKSKDGSFTILNVEEGDYNVTVKYIGLKTRTAKIEIVSNETTNMEVSLLEDKDIVNVCCFTICTAKPNFSVINFPNPFIDYTELVIESDMDVRVRFELVDLSNSIVFSKDLELSVGTNKFNFNLEHLGKGYMIPMVYYDNEAYLFEGKGFFKL